MLREVKSPHGWNDGHTFVLPLPYAQVCFLRKLTKLASDPDSKKGLLPSTVLMLSPLLFKFWAGNCCLSVFPWYFRSSGVFSLFPLRLLFRCLWNIPVYQLEIGFGYQELQLPPSSLMPANVTRLRPTRNSLIVVSSAL